MGEAAIHDDAHRGYRSHRHARKSSLPSIKGVNRNSLKLLMDRPEGLVDDSTPMARRAGNTFANRNNSLQIQT